MHNQPPPHTPTPYVLIVDDERQLANNIALYLTRNGCQALAVHSVAAANLAITERKPDFALVDLKLPDINGIDLCRMLHERYPELPVIVISASLDPASTAALRQTGVRGFVAKPFSLAGLLDLMRANGLSQIKPVTPKPLLAQMPGKVAPRHARGTPGNSANPRIVLYSHDTMGLGHMRRNILLARTLAESRLKASVLLVSGAREIGRFELPAGIDCLVLPSYTKSVDGDYRSRHLDMETRELVNLRSHTINVSVPAFDPDILIADNVPRGALNELDNVLATLNARGRTRCVLGLRDVLDAPARVAAEWRERNNLSAIDWHYEQVWIYGDPAIYNLCDEYQFGARFAAKARFTGYLDARKRAAPKAGGGPVQADAPTRPYNLCLVGGGQDGFALARAFAAAAQPAGTVGVLISGPFMLPEHMRELQSLAADRDDFVLYGFVPEPTLLLQKARRVVAMGGYNTVNEVLAFGRPTLVVPRVRPREEQLVRAERLADLGHIDMLHPDQLDGAAIGAWLAKPDGDLKHASKPIDLDGLNRLVDLVETLLNQQGQLNHAIA
jgi:predicted glycosyltransferase/ActR/RegA family two-component response regulator